MSTPAIITLTDVHKSFGAADEYKILKGVDLEIAEGGITVIIGGSGSGKTVLVKLMIGLLELTSGDIVVDGERFADLDARGKIALRSKFGMVFQHAALFDSMTVQENVAFPLIERRVRRDEIRDRVAEKLGQLGLTGSEAKFPSELSGGMRKRVGLARAAIVNPKIMIFDEPTTGLDPVTTHSVDEMILTAQETFNITSVVISHDMASTFRIADHIAFVYQGKIAAFGTPGEFSSSASQRVREFVSTSGVSLSEINHERAGRRA
jgi:phospholipid/cholesterol/gamma-HCH transport system ATP-binding protein